MKAVRIHNHGGAEALRYEEADEPQPTSPSDVVVKLEAAAVNRIDLDHRTGARAAKFSFPHILGCDGAGTVAAVGPVVNHLQPGDRVCLYPFIGCGQCAACMREDDDQCAEKRFFNARENGTYADYVKITAKNCFPIPSGFSFEEAAAFPLVYSTAWRLLITQAKIRPGETILIVGIGGGVATAAFQIAAAIGARILVASASDEKLAKARALRCEHGINHRNMDVAKEVRRFTDKRGVDLVIDCIGGDGWAKSLASLARGGRLLTCGAVGGPRPTTDLRRIFWNNLKIFGATQSTREEFRQLCRFFECCKAKPVIDTVYPLEQASRAHRRMEDRGHFGKIILRMNG